MVSTLAVLALALALMGAGNFAAQQGLLDEARNRRLSRLLTDAAFPVLCLSRISAMDGATLRARAAVPIALFALLVGGALGGELGARALRLPADSRRAARFCVAMPNWIFLPLPIVQWRYGAAGAQVVLLGNVGAQLFLWTLGVLLLAGRSAESPAKLLLRNMGLWGTAGGIALALAGYTYPAGGLLRGLRWCAERFGESAVWLTPVTVGAQLRRVPVWAFDRALALVLTARLFVSPFLAAGLLSMLRACGSGPLDTVSADVLVLIAAMPVAFSASALAMRFGADGVLSARAVLLSTLISVFSVPLLEAVSRTLFFL